MPCPPRDPAASGGPAIRPSIRPSSSNTCAPGSAARDAAVDPGRRLFLAGSAGLLLAPWVQVRATGAPAWQTDPFTLGVAAGDPAPDGFVLWTRLAPEPLAKDPATPGGMRGESVTVQYEIASDENLRDIVLRGSTVAEARYAWSVHLEVTGLAPDRPYWYRFTSGTAASRIGRARTTPARGDRPQRARFATVSCANYEHGYFAAYRHLAEENPDLVLWLGDYIYEYVDTRGRTVRHHSDETTAYNLPTYRNRYAQYRLDADLQTLHATSTGLFTWDDHEVQNNYAGDWSETYPDPAAFRARRAAAYQVFYEHMPLRPSRSLPSGTRLRIYERYGWGNLAEINLLDGRQYRDEPICMTPENARVWRAENDTSCPERTAPRRSLLGVTQEAWLDHNLRQSQARWNILAQDMQMAQVARRRSDGALGFGKDSWDGYPLARRRLLESLQAHKVRNPLVLAGDIHAWCAADLRIDFDDPRSPVVATEVVGTSIASRGPARNPGRAFYDDNPHIQFFEGTLRGYTVLELRQNQTSVRLRAVSDATDPQATVRTLKTFAIENGKPGAQKAG